MSDDDRIIMNFELTQKRADTLNRLNAKKTRELRIYSTLVNMSFVALGIVSFGMAGIALAYAIQASPEGMRLITSIAGVAGLVLAMVWTRRCVRLSGILMDAAYEIGTQVRYLIGVIGIHLVYLDQDWQTGWGLNREIRTEAEALSIRTPFAIFSMPIREFSIALDEPLARMRGWQAEAAV